MPTIIENTIGMRLVPVPAGQFIMGQADGDWDEVPVHEVHISRQFYMADAPVTNAQFEQFRKKHTRYRGIAGVSEADDAAVVFVSWNDAVAFCQWLSKKEGKPYRLPTEAEWEYACRAGTKSAYWMGDTLPRQHRIDNPDDWKRQAWGDDGDDDDQDILHVRKRPANPWGLHDMHGVVEEWCSDWYGPYEAGTQTDPVGYEVGDFKVSRGGSYGTIAYLLRSANRLAMLPDDTSRLIGFRVVQGPAPSTIPLGQPAAQPFFTGIKQKNHDWKPRVDGTKPFFTGPIPYVQEPDEKEGPEFVPFYPHNHCPAITYCENGDVIACWFSTNVERGREMVILSARFRLGAKSWEKPSLFFKAADRNMTGESLFNDGDRILHFNGIEEAQSWTNLIMVLRESLDNGATWSQPRIISAEHDGFLHRIRNQVIPCTRKTQNGTLLQLCDGTPDGNGGSAVHASSDGGKTWNDLGLGRPYPSFKNGATGAWIAGIHASVVELSDGSLLAFGRGDPIEGRMPMSLSLDGGYTWSYSPSPFPAIGGGQRLVLMRLMEGPLLFVSFSNERKQQDGEVDGIEFTDKAGKKQHGFGMFSALSFDDGNTWTCTRLISEGVSKDLASADYIRKFTMDATHAEPAGYLAAVQAPDGIIHLISSHLHYRFNLAWLRSPMG